MATYVQPFEIWRGAAGEGQFVSYEAEVAEGMVVLDAVRIIQGRQANDMALRWNCKAGKCGSCSAEIDGKPKLMCMARMNEYDKEKPIRVEPMHTFRSVRDLVTDPAWNYEVKQAIPPIQPRKPDADDGTWRMAQSDVERAQEFRKCIECFLCLDVCHVLREHALHDKFAGPRHFVHIAQLEMNPIDAGDRIDALRGEHGVGYCNITKCCTKVCPEGIQITDNAIIPLKERVADRHYDPVRKLLRRLFGRKA